MDAPKPIDRSEFSLKAALQHDLDAITHVLIDVFGLRFAKEVPSLSEPLARWFDFRFRYVEPKPRHVAYSDRITNALPQAARLALAPFLEQVVRGEDINPYQGRGLKRRHDTSRHDHASRTDYLFASWGILHFHLSDEPIPPDRYFSKPADWLAFGIVTDDQFVLIDVLRHSDREGFSDPALLETVARCWPLYMEQFRIKSVAPAGRPFTQAEIHFARDHGGNVPFIYNDQTFIGPGGGYTSAGTTMKAAAAMMHIARTLGPLAATLWTPVGPFRSHEALASIADPSFSLRLHAGGLGVWEERSRVLFVQPPGLNVITHDLRWLSDLIIPPWALSEVVREKGRFDELFCEPVSQSVGKGLA